MPPEKGVAEHLNGSLVEMARSMLLDSKLPKKFWGEAILTAIYLKKRTPSRCWTRHRLKSDMVKSQRWATWECLAVMHMHKASETRHQGLTQRHTSVSRWDKKMSQKVTDYMMLHKGRHSIAVMYKLTKRSKSANKIHKILPRGKSDYQLIVEFSEVSEIDITQPEQVQESSPLEPQRSARTRKQRKHYDQESSNASEVP